MERTSLLFSAVESQLGERQVCSELIHGGVCDSHSVVLIVADPAVCCLSSPIRGRVRTVYNQVSDK